MRKKTDIGTIDINIRFKENCTRNDYRSVASAWLKSQTVFRDTLKELEEQEQLSHNLAWKLYRVFKTSQLDYKLKKLQLLELATNEKDTEIKTQTTTPQIPAGKTILPSFTKASLKEKIIQLAKYQEQPNYKYEPLIKCTSELLSHPDLTDDERYRYSIYYSELVEYRNYKLYEKEKNSKIQQVETTYQNGSNFSTSISLLRNQMANQLQKLRETYSIDDKWNVSKI
ncbi:MAG: hypothetical protein ACW99A_15705 [Candidatus Kariarchaeaceae archaeon]|jgi:hypothetical protein